MKAAIVGIAGPELTPAEAELLQAHRPAGVILFARNITNPRQLADLTTTLRSVLPSNALLMVDQEGGRVARLRPPHWRAHPPVAAIGRLFDRDAEAGLRAAWLHGAVIGAECKQAGFDLVAAPVLDRSVPDAHDIIGDRAFGADPAAIGRLGRALAEGLLTAGVQPIGKHAPGHGRAAVDSHQSLPVVEGPDAEAEADLLPFALNRDLPWIMTAHIQYPAWDPARPATLSRRIIEDILRSRAGLTGVLVTDDLAMGALKGTPAERACAALEAGCDVALYCAGDLGPTAALLGVCPDATPAATQRLEAARARASQAQIALDLTTLATERDRLLT